ncbi:type II secretion system protein [Salmonella enterica subsp. enterica serovar Java]|nr:type II secretion system protein [Salmonella enterica subsp. enterica serovar Java]HAE4647977.1 type II secretion system protein [Salmonella enterica subsp. enterica serovar 4,[5],12:b:-]
MGNSIMNIRMMKSRGFSLLEVIFVLAFLGIVLLAVGNYVRKLIDEKNRQTAADAVVQEIYGVLQFVNTDSIETFKNKNYDPNDVANRGMKKVTNPLYQSPHIAVYPDAKTGADAALEGLTNNPIWLAHPHDQVSLIATKDTVSPYIARNYSTDITSLINNDIAIVDGGKTHYSHSLKWSQAIWGKGSVRSYFTDSGCQSRGGGTSNAIYFSQQFLSCNENPALRNSEIGISRIDLVNKKGSFNRAVTADDYPVSVDRVDVYVSFSPVDGNSARVAQFITPLMDAFRIQKIMPNTDNIFLVRSKTGANDNKWMLLNKKNGLPSDKKTPPVDLAMLSDLPNLVGKLQKGYIYAVRFTFDGSGDYLRSDGLNAATKLCWNASDGTAGPCLTSSSQETLVLKRRDNPQEFANIQVNNVISKASYIDGETPEYNTSPQIQYKTFGQSGTMLGPFYKEINDGKTDEIKLCGHENVKECKEVGNSAVTPTKIADTQNGAISVPIQVCPAAENGVTLNPRLSASVSSVVSGIKKHGDDIPDTSKDDVFNSQESVIYLLDKRKISINRLGGVALQIYKCDPGDPNYKGQPCYAKNQWKIASVVAAEDISEQGEGGRAWQYYNPPWLSVMITTWCSSVPQP